MKTILIYMETAWWKKKSNDHEHFRPTHPTLARKNLINSGQLSYSPITFAENPPLTEQNPVTRSHVTRWRMDVSKDVGSWNIVTIIVIITNHFMRNNV